MNHLRTLTIIFTFSTLFLRTASCSGEDSHKRNARARNLQASKQDLSSGPESRLLSRNYSTDLESLLLLAEGVKVQDPSPAFDIRLDAISILGEHKEERVIALLWRLVHEERSRALRNAAMFSLAKLGDRRALAQIIRLFRDAEPPRRVSLAYQLAETGRREAIPLLLEALETAPAESLSVLIRVLRVRGLRVGLEQIEAMFRSRDLEDKGGAAEGLVAFATGLLPDSSEGKKVQDLLWSILETRDDVASELILGILPRICGGAVPFDVCIERLKEPVSISQEARIQELAVQTRTRIEKMKRLQPLRDRIEEYQKRRIQEGSIKEREKNQ